MEECSVCGMETDGSCSDGWWWREWEFPDTCQVRLCLVLFNFRVSTLWLNHTAADNDTFRHCLRRDQITPINSIISGTKKKISKLPTRRSHRAMSFMIWVIKIFQLIKLKSEIAVSRTASPPHRGWLNFPCRTFLNEFDSRYHSMSHLRFS